MDLNRLTYEQQERIRTKIFISILKCRVFNPNLPRYEKMYHRLIMLNYGGK